MKRLFLFAALVIALTAVDAIAKPVYRFDPIRRGSHSKIKNKEVVRVKTSDAIEIGGRGAGRWKFWQDRSRQEVFQR